MVKLFVLNGQHKGETITFKSGEDLIGQGDDVSLRLTDTWISWNHAKVTWNGATYELVDLDSTNGTFVNCRRVNGSIDLNNDDLIFLGRTHLLAHVDLSEVPTEIPNAAPTTQGSKQAESMTVDVPADEEFEDIDLDLPEIPEDDLEIPEDEFEEIIEDELEDSPDGPGNTKVDMEPPKEFELNVDSGELKLDTDFELLDLEDLELE